MLTRWFNKAEDTRPTKRTLERRLRAEFGFSRREAKGFTHIAGKCGLTAPKKEK
jgi:hypothetical protein